MAPTTSHVTVSRRPCSTHGDPDPRHDDYLIVADGNVIGGTSYATADEHAGTYNSWGLLYSPGHATRQAAEQAQVDAAIAAGLPVLDIRIDTAAAYRVNIGDGEELTETGTKVQHYLDDAARCAAPVTGTSTAFTINHSHERHHGRACEHDGRIVTYRPQADDEPTLIPAALQHIPADRAPLPHTGPAAPELWQRTVDHMRDRHAKDYAASWQVTRNPDDTVAVIFLPGFCGTMDSARRHSLYAWERTLREAGFAATVRHDLDFEVPNAPTTGPWWIHITGATPQPTPITFTKTAVTVYDIASNTAWSRISHRTAEAELRDARTIGDTLHAYDTTDRRGRPLRVVLHHTQPGPDGHHDAGGVYEFTR